MGSSSGSNSVVGQSGNVQTGQLVTTAGSNLSFNNTYAATDTSDFISAVITAEKTLESLWTASTPITMNVDFVASNQGASGFLAENEFYTVDVTYSQLVGALAAHDGYSVYAQDAVATLPATDPNTSVNGGDFSLPDGYAQMLGLANSNATDTVTLNTYYFSSGGTLDNQEVIDAIDHELSEGTMGRIGGLGDQNGLWSTMDLFRFTAAGIRDYTDGRDGQTTYFSYDGGAAGTLSSAAGLSYNNEYSGNVQVNGGDTADLAQVDVFGAGETGESNTLSQTDIEMMDALGWEPLNATDVVAETAPTSIVATTNQPFAFTGAYAVTVADPGGVNDVFTTVVSTADGGDVSASGAGGATVSNSGTTSLTISGTLSQINVALASLTYTTTSVANDTITVTTTDPNAGDSPVTKTISVAVSGIVNLPSGGSEELLLTGLPSGVTEKIEYFSGPDATGTLIETITDYQSGGSQMIVTAGLSGGVTEEIEDFTGANATGTNTEIIFDLQSGGSQVDFLAYLPTGDTEEVEYFTGANGTGIHTATLIDFQSGGSQYQMFSGLPSGVTEVIEDFSGASATGTDTEVITDLQSGGSQVAFFANLPSGVTEEVAYFSGANAVGTHTATLLDFQSGGSQYQMFTGLPSGVTEQIEDFSGLSATGTLTETITDYQSGGSQMIVTAGLPGGVTEEIEDFSGANATGANTEVITDLQSGGSQVAFLAYLPSGVTEEVEYFTGANDTGTHTATLLDFQSGGSQYQTFTGLPTGVSEELSNYTGASVTGLKTETIVEETNGSSVDISFTYNGNGTETQYTEEGLNASGQETGFAVYSASGQLLSGSGSEPPPDFDGAAPPIANAGTAAGSSAQGHEAVPNTELLRSYMASTFTPSTAGEVTPVVNTGSLTQEQNPLTTPLASQTGHT